MVEVCLEKVLARSPVGLPVPLACHMVRELGRGLGDRIQPITPAHIQIEVGTGELRIAHRDIARVPTPYLSPEEAHNGSATARSTVFALGSILYEAITGRPPFARSDDADTRRALRTDPVSALAGRFEHANEDLDAVLRRALAKDPFVRFASPSELASRLARFLSDELHTEGAKELGEWVRVHDAASAPTGARVEPPPPPPNSPTAAELEAAELNIEAPPARSVLPSSGARFGGRLHSATSDGPPPPPTARGTLELDELALAHRPRLKPRPLPPPTVPARRPTWFLWFGLLLAAVLVAALSWEFLVRPLLLSG